MNGKVGIALVFSSIVMGGCIVTSSLIQKDIITTKKQNIVTLTNGEVNLGEVYKEQYLVDAYVTDKNGKNIISIIGIDPTDINDRISSQLNSLANQLNIERNITDPKMMLTAKTLSLTDDGNRVKVNTYINYTSSHFPFYTLTLYTSDDAIEKGDSIQDVVREMVNNAIQKSSADVKSSMFIITGKK